MGPSANDRKGKRWRARYVDERGREHARGFARKVDAQHWLDKQTAAIISGTHIAPRDAQLRIQEWCDLWIEGYKVNRKGSVRAARTHIRQIVDEFGGMPLSAVRPSEVKAWVARLQADGLERSYVYALHSRLSQILSDAVHDGILGRNPCSHRTAPPMGKAKFMLRRRSRSGRYTTRCLTTCGSLFCWAHSPACGSRKRPGCGSPT